MRTVGGIVTALNRKYTKRGDLMATFVLEDLGAALEVMVFPKTMAEYGHLLEDDAIVVREGPARHARRHAEDHRDGGHAARARARRRPAGAGQGASSARSPTPKVGRLKEILSEHPGDSPVFVHLEGPEKTTVLRLGDDFLVDAGNGLFAELRVLLGADCIA